MCDLCHRVEGCSEIRTFTPTHISKLLKKISLNNINVSHLIPWRHSLQEDVSKSTYLGEMTGSLYQG